MDACTSIKTPATINKQLLSNSSVYANIIAA